MSITVTADNSITVRVPNGASLKNIEKFIQSKSAWIDKKIALNNRVLAVNSSVKAYETVLVDGKNIPLKIAGTNGVEGDIVCVKSLSNLQKVFCDNYGGAFFERFNVISQRYGFKVSSVKFRSYKARWGCCDSAGNIVFNYKLLMLPTDLQDYVIIHELCHTKVMNHSSRFWAEVKRCCGDYSVRRKRIKEYAFLTRLYP